ncbi:MAG TPA: acyl-[ACP]--phospholipid O-acyltransferase [Propylenella sp.]
MRPAKPISHLFRTRRFAPLFWAQFFGAFNDNFFRQATALLVAYRLGSSTGLSPASLVPLATATFVAPFILFSAFAGQLADFLDKAVVARSLKLAEIVLMTLAGIALISGSMAALFSVLFLMGAQSALFGPVKYSLLPTHLRDDELIQGNALIEGATFLAILIGSLLGGALIGTDRGIAMLGVALCAIAVLGYVAARFIPPAPPVATVPRPSLNIVRSTRELVAAAHRHRSVWLSILGISWFWTVGAILLSLLPAIAKDLLGGAESLASYFLGVFSIGIGAGSMLCARWLGGEITPRHVPFASIGISLLLFVLASVLSALPTPVAESQGLQTVLAGAGSWSLTIVLFLLAATAGFYAVPLFAVLQHSAPEEAKARMIGANNVLNASMMAVGMVVVAILSSGLHLPIAGIVVLLALLNLVATAIIVHLLSRLVLKAITRALLGTIYRVEVRGIENFAKAGNRKMVVANHASFLDGAMLAAFMPSEPIFAVSAHVAKTWWARPLLRLVDFAPIDSTNPLALKSLVREVEKGRPLVIFPEGRLTVTGSLMKVYDGPGLVADKTAADIIPVRIDGLQHTFFSRLKGRVARRFAPKVTLTALPPRPLVIDDMIHGRERRKEAGRLLYDMMSDMLFRTSELDRTLFRSLIDATQLHGRKYPIVEDVELSPLAYGRLLTGSFVLGRSLKGISVKREAVGILLPNSVGAVAVFFALQSSGRVPAMLNPSTGIQGVLAACRAANVSTVLCARRFVERAKLESLLAGLEKEVRVVYLEDLRTEIGIIDKLLGVVASRLPNIFYRDDDANGAAVILFTSGSEGAPKGVVLSHRNLQANRHQVGARIAFNSQDIVFNVLPMFHSFGLTVGTLLPVLAGIRTFLYPSPLHYRIIPELVYQTNATVFFGTDTFLRSYARSANPYDFRSVRILGAGAERVSDETQRLWNDKFGIRILEGYGATETSPVIAFNTPMHFRPGTVGRLMPGIEDRVDPVPGIDDGGRLYVKGPNVMLGYMRESAPGQLEPVEAGWYDTGDIVSVDAEGFVRIMGRAKRFAKIAGEMVSLAAVEEVAARASPGFRHAAISLPDQRKGEQIVLVTEDPALTRECYQKHASAIGAAEITFPRVVIMMERLPVLGTGKTDYPAIVRMVSEGARREVA